ncbi:MAG: hypothetical protein AUJ56_13300 [Zetaproteobacteria bacterium CG1_02_49_23]|nr:MAG: hypothetical protein AUJ56_13300 [Zetaproteobacteria bacterium CG1_02_49_23]
MRQILLLEDHPDAQLWLTEALHMAFGDQIYIKTTPLLEEAKQIFAQQTFDLVIADLHVPDGSGINLIRAVKSSDHSCPCIVATIFSDKQHLFPALQAGADGYLLKDEGKAEISNLLQGILSGRPPISANVAQQMLLHFQQVTRTKKEPPSKLTEREQETLLYISKGMSTKECAELMGISTHTASEHIKNVYKKLGIHSRAEAASEAINLGLS